MRPVLAGYGLATAVLILSLLAGCREEVGSARGSNVVLVTIDALRARNLASHGYARDTAPRLDALAREGASFQNAFAPAPWTIPSLGSLLTSTYPHQHKGHMYRTTPEKVGVAALRKGTTSLAQVLDRKGFATAMFFESAYPLLKLGLGEGFDLQHELRGEGTGAIRAWLRAQRGRRFFLWIHFFKPHIPYFPSERTDGLFQAERLQDHRALAEYWSPEECARRHAAADPEQLRIRIGFYDEAIRDSDILLGEVMDELHESGLAEKTLVAVTSDHGEEFFEHGGCDHGLTLYDELLHVPLVLWHPGVVPAGTTLTGQVRTLDVAPTLLELLAIEPPAGFEGQSLVPHLRGEDVDLPVYSGFPADAEVATSLREGGFKYVHHPSRGVEELYDLRADPGETENLAASRLDPRLRELREKTRRWLGSSPAGQVQEPIHLDATQRERLRALGYLIEE